jgi:hypothetical protein
MVEILVDNKSGIILKPAGSGQRKVAGTCKSGNALSGSIKRGEILD